MPRNSRLCSGTSSICTAHSTLKSGGIEESVFPRLLQQPCFVPRAYGTIISFLERLEKGRSIDTPYCHTNHKTEPRNTDRDDLPVALTRYWLRSGPNAEQSAVRILNNSATLHLVQTHSADRLRLLESHHPRTHSLPPSMPSSSYRPRNRLRRQ